MSTALINSEAQLRKSYKQPKEMILKAVLKEIDQHGRQFISLSPFLVLATHGDASPKGDAPGFVKVVDDKTLLIPDRAGNNKLDSLKNIIDHPKIGMIFFIPGFIETFRVNGTARITMDADLLEPLAVQGKVPNARILVSIEEAYFHCGKALIRSKLWDPEAQVARSIMPTMGQMVVDRGAGLDAGEIETDYQEALVKRLY